MSVKGRIDIFAACQEDSIHPGKDFPGSIFVRQRGYDNWYEPCTFKSLYVSAVQPDAMRPLSVIGCRGDSYCGCGCEGVAVPGFGNTLRQSG